MSNKIVPSGSLAVTTNKAQQSLQISKPSSTPDVKVGKVQAFLKSFRAKFLGILNIKGVAEIGDAFVDSILLPSPKPPENTPYSCRVDLSNLQKTQGYISTKHTAYELLFGDFSDVVIEDALLAVDRSLPANEVKKIIAGFNSYQKLNSVYRLPTVYRGNFNAILAKAWEKVNTNERISLNTQFAISSAMDLQFNTLKTLESCSLEDYKERVQLGINKVDGIVRKQIQANPNLLQRAYGLDGENITRLLFIFLSELTADQFVNYTINDYIGGISSDFGTICLESLLQSVGVEYLFKHPQLDKNNELRIGPYMIQPNRHLADLSYANSALTQNTLILATGNSDEDKKSIFVHSVAFPHETFAILLVDRFMQFASYVEKSIPNYQKQETDEPLKKMFRRISKGENQGYLNSVLAFLQNTGTEGMRQLIRILMVSAPIDATFSADILAWIQQVEKEGLLNFNDFMYERLLAEQNTENRIGHIGKNTVFKDYK